MHLDRPPLLNEHLPVHLREAELLSAPDPESLHQIPAPIHLYLCITSLCQNDRIGKLIESSLVATEVSYNWLDHLWPCKVVLLNKRLCCSILYVFWYLGNVVQVSTSKNLVQYNHKIRPLNTLVSWDPPSSLLIWKDFLLMTLGVMEHISKGVGWLWYHQSLCFGIGRY